MLLLPSRSKLDDTEFRNPFDRAYVRLVEDRDGGRGGEMRWCTYWLLGSLPLPGQCFRRCLGRTAALLALRMLSNSLALHLALGTGCLTYPRLAPCALLPQVAATAAVAVATAAAVTGAAGAAGAGGLGGLASRSTN